MLGGWLPAFFSSSSSIADAGTADDEHETSPPLPTNPVQEQWRNLQNRHMQECEDLIGRLVTDIDDLKARAQAAEDELRLFKAGRKADSQELAALKEENERLKTGGSVRLLKDDSGTQVDSHLQQGVSLAVTILDFEQDCFAPSVFRKPEAGRYAARQLRDSILATVPESSPGMQLLTLVFLRGRQSGLGQDLVLEGVVKSGQELEAFIESFNHSHPLFMVIESNDSKELILQRQRALAFVFSRMASCTRLVLGRWALDLNLAELLAPSSSNDEGPNSPVFDDKIRFVEPFLGTYIGPALTRRQPQVVDLPGLLRCTPLRRHRFATRPVINRSRGLHDQDPPICLDYYLKDCSEEQCSFCHAYELSSDAIAALRTEVSATPCAAGAQGLVCPAGASCHFAHWCPRPLCRQKACGFAPSMHRPPRPRPTQDPRHSFAGAKTPGLVSAGGSNQDSREIHACASQSGISSAVARWAAGAPPSSISKQSSASRWKPDPKMPNATVAAKVRASSSNHKSAGEQPSDFSKLTDAQLVELAEKMRLEEEAAMQALGVHTAGASGRDGYLGKAAGFQSSAPSSLFGPAPGGKAKRDRAEHAVI